MERRVYPTIGVPVRRYIAESGVEWLDWEGAAEPAPEPGAQAEDISGRP